MMEAKMEEGASDLFAFGNQNVECGNSFFITWMASLKVTGKNLNRASAPEPIKKRKRVSTSLSGLKIHIRRSGSPTVPNA